MLSRDEEGYFTYRGRADDMLKVAGKWLSPQEVENCLLRHPAVRECAVVGVSDPDGLTRTRAFVVADGAAADLGESLRAFVREQLESYKVPREIVVLESFPRTHLGKVDRGWLRGVGAGG
jgi:acyl-coenzyme A synthetase/AMP-(fatty) acid ligase